MEEKNTRYIYTFITLDKIERCPSLVTWDQNDYEPFILSQDKHYGLKIVSEKEELFIRIEYTNIIWEYKLLFSSYKKKYKPLTSNDEKWYKIEKQVLIDLKMMGLEDLKEDVLNNLKNNKYFEYKTKKEEQFKNYCI